MRRCINEDCRVPLKPSEQGALCSPCYFAIVTDPGLADPAPQFAEPTHPEGAPPQWQVSAPPSR